MNVQNCLLYIMLAARNYIFTYLNTTPCYRLQNRILNKYKHINAQTNFPTVNISLHRNALQCLQRILVVSVSALFGVRNAVLFDSYVVILNNPRLVTNNVAFYDCKVLSNFAKHLFYDLYAMWFLQTIQTFDTSQTLTRFILKILTKMC